MPREKEGRRDAFNVLMERYGKALVPKCEAAKILGVSSATMTRLISKGKITPTGDFVSLWHLARFLVG